MSTCDRLASGWPKREIRLPPLQPDGRIEASSLLGTGSSVKRAVFLDGSVNVGPLVDMGHGRSMGDDGLLVGVLMAARGRSKGVDDRMSIGIEADRRFFPDPWPLVGRRTAVSPHTTPRNFLESDFLVRVSSAMEIL